VAILIVIGFIYMLFRPAKEDHSFGIKAGNAARA
jgi:hypothetical protein